MIVSGIVVGIYGNTITVKADGGGTVSCIVPRGDRVPQIGQVVLYDDEEMVAITGARKAASGAGLWSRAHMLTGDAKSHTPATKRKRGLGVFFPLISYQPSDALTGEGHLWIAVASVHESSVGVTITKLSVNNEPMVICDDGACAHLITNPRTGMSSYLQATPDGQYTTGRIVSLDYGYGFGVPSGQFRYGYYPGPTEPLPAPGECWSKYCMDYVTPSAPFGYGCLDSTFSGVGPYSGWLVASTSHHKGGADDECEYKLDSGYLVQLVPGEGRATLLRSTAQVVVDSSCCAEQQCSQDDYGIEYGCHYNCCGIKYNNEFVSGLPGAGTELVVSSGFVSRLVVSPELREVTFADKTKCESDLHHRSPSRCSCQSSGLTKTIADFRLSDKYITCCGLRLNIGEHFNEKAKSMGWRYMGSLGDGYDVWGSSFLAGRSYVIIAGEGRILVAEASDEATVQHLSIGGGMSMLGVSDSDLATPNQSGIFWFGNGRLLTPLVIDENAVKLFPPGVSDISLSQVALPVHRYMREEKSSMVFHYDSIDSGDIMPIVRYVNMGGDLVSAFNHVPDVDSVGGAVIGEINAFAVLGYKSEIDGFERHFVQGDNGTFFTVFLSSSYVDGASMFFPLEKSVGYRFGKLTLGG